MKEFDVVLLTDSRYVNPSKIDPYIQNVLTEDGLVMEGLEKLNLKNVYFKGNIKLYDPINEIGIENFNKDFLVKKRFWFAASTHKYSGRWRPNRCVEPSGPSC